MELNSKNVTSKGEYKMKKIIALALALALIFTNGLISFASSSIFDITIDLNDNTFTVGITEVLIIEGNIEEMQIYDVNGFMEFGTIYNISGSNSYAVEVTAKCSGATVIRISDKEGRFFLQTGAVFIDVNPEIEEEQFVVGDVNLDGVVDLFDLIMLAKMIVGA